MHIMHIITLQQSCSKPALAIQHMYLSLLSSDSVQNQRRICDVALLSSRSVRNSYALLRVFFPVLSKLQVQLCSVEDTDIIVAPTEHNQKSKRCMTIIKCLPLVSIRGSLLVHS